jgi:hypothetical protein
VIYIGIFILGLIVGACVGVSAACVLILAGSQERHLRRFGELDN